MRKLQTVIFSTMLALSLGACGAAARKELGQKQGYQDALRFQSGEDVKSAYGPGWVEGWKRGLSQQDAEARKQAEAKAIADAAAAEAAKEAARVKAEADALAAEEAKKEALRKLVPCQQ